MHNYADERTMTTAARRRRARRIMRRKRAATVWAWGRLQLAARWELMKRESRALAAMQLDDTIPWTFERIGEVSRQARRQALQP